MSPLGAVRRKRGSRNPEAYSSILNPGGTWSLASLGRGTSRGELLAERVAPGGGRASTVIFRRTPGASVVQSPKAFLPVSSLPSDLCAAAFPGKTQGMMAATTRETGIRG